MKYIPTLFALLFITLPAAIYGQTISGQTFFDANKDGIRQVIESPVDAVVILEIAGDPVATTATSIDGTYTFENVAPGNGYRVYFEPSTDELLVATSYQAGDDTSIDSDIFFGGRTTSFVLEGDFFLSNIDAGWSTCDLEVSVPNNDVTCNAECEGILIAEITGGTAPFTYTWSDGNTAASPAGLCTGEYSVTITDNLGCTAVATGVVIETSDLNVEISVGEITCADGSTGSLTADVTGGTPGYTYQWGTNPAQTTATATDLSRGWYSVTVTDTDGCAVSDNIFLDESQVLSVTSVVTPSSCSGVCDGTATLGVNGGVAPYTYIWATGDTNPDLTGLCPGAYLVTVVDALGCTITTVIEIETINLLAVFIPSSQVSCNGDSDGVFTVDVSGGTPPYTYSWSADLENNSATQTGLPGGFHSVTVTDNNGCESVAGNTMFEPFPFDFTILRTGGCSPDGGPFTATVDVGGGIPPYTFEWSDGSTGDTIPTGMPFALYNLTITDGNGCLGFLQDVTAGRTDELEVPFILSIAGCEDGTDLSSIIADPPFSTPFLVTLGMDTIEVDASYVITEPGLYQIITVTPDGFCRTIFPLAVDGQGLPAGVNMVTSPSQNCDQYDCISVIILSDSILVSPSLQISFFGPDGTLLGSPSGRTNVCGLEEAGTYTAQVVYGCDTLMLSVDVDEPDVCGTLTGTLFSTTNAACMPSGSDVQVPFTMVRFFETTTGDTYFAFTDNDGFYATGLPAGTYLATPLVNGNEPDNSCPDAIVSITIDEAAVLDLYSVGEVPCPQMELDISIWNQRRCFDNSLFLYYYNQGNVAADNVVLTVELDPFYENISATHPFTQVGQTLTFDLGTVPFCEFGSIRVDFTISCDAELGQTHCVNGSITPSGDCNADENWQGGLVNITEAACDGDSIRFTIANIGLQELSVPLSYIVVEDGIMVQEVANLVASLGSLEEVHIAIPADGSVFQLITNQEPFAPTTSDPSLLVQGCGPNPSQGFTNILALGNGVDWQETVCEENSGSWDPNDKRGYPIGHDGNQIKPGTRLDYNIRFQNTGTDTAFTVVIRDTISKALDLSTFRRGSSSHEYRLTIDSNRLLTFTFPNIDLVDSFTNVLGSQGMVTFSIDHAEELVPGDRIENTAGIYFDFNEPVITNTSLHIIETDPIPTGLRRIEAQQYELSVFPNPATERLNVRTLDQKVDQSDVFEVRDINGRVLTSVSALSAANGIALGNLPNGYYVLVLADGAGRAKGRTGFVVAR